MRLDQAKVKTPSIKHIISMDNDVDAADLEQAQKLGLIDYSYFFTSQAARSS
jgi:hypothetical protein